MKNKYNDIALVISSLGSGGAERVFSIMANYWTKKDMDVTIYTLNNSNSFYELDPKVTIKKLDLYKKSPNKLFGIVNNLRRVKKMKKEIIPCQHDVIISCGTKTNILALIAAMSSKIPVIVSEITYPSRANIGGELWSILRDIMYFRANKVVAQTKVGKECFNESIKKKTVVIPNPVNTEAANNLNENVLTGTSKTLLAMGRLGHEKGFDLLIRAFAQIKDKNPDWKLIIWGEGKERKNIEKIISNLKMEDRVMLPGKTKEPLAKMAEADLFVLSSRREGFPNVLCEAMTVGMPVVATDCLCGPREIITDQVDGVLIEPENIEELAESMHELMNDENKRRYIGENAKESIKRFEINNVMEMWSEVIEKSS
ncbi:glycosyltransferase family 4 protein [Wukongibacter baidiensis]|uniref:glycosyltransferase family 4 protein n=1 Tax=Wukongibacter baidiensis TaxID=1723361 RepID=UPI003D7F5A38